MGAIGNTAGKRRQPGVDCTDSSVEPAHRNRRPRGSSQPEASVQLKDMSKHECVHGRGLEDEGSGNRRNDEQSVSWA